MERGGAGGWRGSPNRGWRNLRTGQRRPMGRQDGAGAGPGAVKPRLLGSAGLGRSQVRVRWSWACGRRRGRGPAQSGERRPAGGTGPQLREQVPAAEVARPPQGASAKAGAPARCAPMLR